MIDPLVEAASGLSSATIHEAAGRTGALPSAIKPLAPHVSLYGRAFPLVSPPGDNLFLHHAIYAAAPGDILVADCGDGAEYGAWGEVMAVAAQARGVAGIVTSGGVRDSLQILALGFPVFAANVCVRGTGKDPLGAGSIGEPITLGDTIVHASDLVIGDADGVVIVPAGRAAAILADARRRDAAELDLFTRLRAGETTLDLYRLPSITIDDDR